MSLLKARSHSQDVARQENISKGQRWRVGKGSSISGRPTRIGSKLLNGGDSRDGCRIPAEFVSDSVLPFPAV
jgi:hypothetical protein